MKVILRKHEYWPVYSEAMYGESVEIPEKLWTDYLAAKERFDDLLSEIDMIVE